MGKWSLDTKSKKVCVLIDPQEGLKYIPVEYLNALDYWLSENANAWAYIVHSLDTLEDGTPKTPHIHLYAELNVCQRLLTTLNKLADCLDCDTRQISVEKCQSMEGAIQYMIHRDNPEKYQYPPSDIRCSFDESELKTILESEGGTLSLERIIGVCGSAPNLTEVIRKIGVPHYVKYRNLILDIWKSVHGRI